MDRRFWMFLSLGLLTACGGSSTPPTAGASSPATGGVISSDAPAWAREGDRQTSEGRVFVCEGEGATEDEAFTAATGICNAKICELCGVEVKAVTETTETLTGVEMQRKVMETCRRVRKAPDQVQYKQSGCGPEGCRSWVQLLYTPEAEASECKAYAEGNFADPEQCERLIEDFRSVPHLTAAAFWRRKELLDQAIIACADIDVRPTPRIQALDEVLWQGVISPKATYAQLERPPKSAPVAEQTRFHFESRREQSRVGMAKTFYRPIDRQGLLETKFLVDRITTIRDFMANRALVYDLLEARADIAGDPQRPPNDFIDKFLAAPKEPTYGTPNVHYYIVEYLYGELPQFQVPVREAMAKLYPPQHRSSREMDVMVSFYARDRTVTKEEWSEVWAYPKSLRYKRLLDQPNHGSPAIREERYLAAVERVREEKRRLHDVATSTTPQFIVSMYPRFPSWLQEFFTWSKWRSLFSNPQSRTADPSWVAARDTATGWIIQRIKKELDDGDLAKNCRYLDDRLDELEGQGVNTKAFAPDICRCLEARRVKERALAWDDDYRRALAWQLDCVTKKGGKS